MNYDSVFEYQNRQYALMLRRLLLFKQNKINLTLLINDLLALRDAISENSVIDEDWDEQFTSLLLAFDSYTVDSGGICRSILYNDLIGEWKERYLKLYKMVSENKGKIFLIG